MKVFYILVFFLLLSMGFGIYVSTAYKLQISPVTIKDTTKTKPVTTSNVITTPTPIKSKCGKGGSCNASEIALHNTPSDCWVYLNPINKAYDITSYVSDTYAHPGGDVITPYCGTNIYSVFLGMTGGHKHSGMAMDSVLQAYYIGPFQP